MVVSAPTLPKTFPMFSVLGQVVPNAAQYLFEDYPKQAKYLTATFDDRGMPIPVLGKTPLVKALASRMTGYLSKFDIKDFDKNPELGGLTTARLPITPLILMFYASMIPARMHSAVERAPFKPDGQKDYREVRDVFFRDITSIALFLFGLEILNAKMLEGVQQMGRVAPSAIFPSSSAKLQVLGGQPEFWSRWPQLAVDDKVKHLKGDEHSAISHPALRKQYYLANDGVLGKIVSNPINREGLVPLFEQQRNALSGFSNRPPFNNAMEAVENGLRLLVNSAQDVDETIKSALHLGSSEAKGHNSRSYWRALDPIREQVFSLPVLTGHETVDKLTLPQLQQAMAKRVETAQDSLHATLAKLDPPGNGKTGNPALTTLLDAARSGQGKDLTDELQHWALNNGERINRHLTDHLGLAKGSKPFREQFDHYWNSLHTLQTQAPVYHSRRHAQELLTQPETGNRLLEGVKTVFRHSHEAMAHLAHLETVAKAENVTTSTLGPFGKKLFEPREFLANAAIRLRTPADWLSLVFIVAALGYFPVWFNETLTNYLFDRGSGKDGNKDSAQNSPKGGKPGDPIAAHGAGSSAISPESSRHHKVTPIEASTATAGLALSPAAAPARTLTPVAALMPEVNPGVSRQQVAPMFSTALTPQTLAAAISSPPRSDRLPATASFPVPLTSMSGFQGLTRSDAVKPANPSSAAVGPGTGPRGSVPDPGNGWRPLNPFIVNDQG